MRKLKILVLIISILAGTQPGKLLSAAQQKKEIEQAQLKHEVYVVLKLIHFFVLDKKGNPITDLQQQDFELFLDGQSHEITAFEKHILPLKKAASKVPPVETKPSEAGPKQIPVNRKFYLLFDYYRSDIWGINTSKKSAVHFIETQLLPSDEISILIYSKTRGLVVHGYLTKDHIQAVESIKNIKGIPNRSSSSDSSMDVVHASAYIIALKDFCQAINNIQGNKSLVLFSAGIDNSLLYNPDYPEIRYDFEELSKDMADSNLSLFAVNTGGTRDFLSHGRRTGDQTLRLLSDSSGGQYFSNVQYQKAIAEGIQKVTGNYYVLGFNISQAWDGKFHEIKVNVNRPGCRLHIQRGYYNPKTFDKLTKFEKKLQLLELAFGKDYIYEEPAVTAMSAFSCMDNNQQFLILAAEIFPDQLTGIFEEEAEIWAFVSDEDNNRTEFNLGNVEKSFPLEGRVIPYTVLPISAGTYKCRMVFRNKKTGKGVVAGTQVTIPEKSSSEISLETVLIINPGQESTWTQIKTKKDKKKKNIPVLNDFFPNLSPEDHLIQNEIVHGTEEIHTLVRCRIPGIPSSSLDISAEIIEASSQTIIPVSFSTLQSQQEKDLYFARLSIKLPSLEPGDFRLVISIKSEALKKTARTELPFSIR